MNEESRWTRYVASQLDSTLIQIPDAAANRLVLARQAALRAQKKKRSGMRVLWSAGQAHFLLSGRWLAQAGGVAALCLAVAYWHAAEYIDHVGEIDTAILTDDLPLDVVTDQGFAKWLTETEVRS